MSPRRGRSDRAHDRSPKLFLHRRSGIYQLAYYPTPESTARRFKSTGAKTLAGAKTWADAERDRIGSVRRGHEIETTAAQAAVTIDRFFPLLEADYIENNRRALRTLRSNIKRHLAPDFGSLRADGLTYKTLADTRTAMLRAGLAHGTINRCVALLHRGYKLAHKIGMIGRMPTFDFPMYNEDEFVRDGIVSEAELAAVNAAEPWAAVRDFNSWAYVTGMRHGEIAKLAWEWFEPETFTITLPRSITKNKKPRVLPIPDALPELRAILMRRWKDRRPGCPLIFHHDGQSLHLPNRWVWAWKRAGLPMKPAKRATTARPRYQPAAKCFHDLRRTAVRNLMLAGVPEKAIMLITGHLSRSIFERHYNVMNAPEVRAAFTQLGEHLAAKKPAARMPFLMRHAAGSARPAGARRSTPARRATKSAAGRSAIAG